MADVVSMGFAAMTMLLITAQLTYSITQQSGLPVLYQVRDDHNTCFSF